MKTFGFKVKIRNLPSGRHKSNVKENSDKKTTHKKRKLSEACRYKRPKFHRKETKKRIREI